MITEEGSKGKGKLVKSAHGLARAVEDAISAKDAVVATVVSVGDKWRLNGRIQCRIGTMGLVEVTCRGVEDVQIDDSILVRKVGRGPTSRWIFVGWHWGMREGAGASGTMIPTVRLDSIPPHAATHQDAGADEINVGGLSGDLADAQDPKAHSSSHQDGGSDEINVAGLSGELADGQTPKTHASSHQDGGSDEISVAGLSGALADQQDANKIKGVDVIDTAIGDGKVLVYRTVSGDLGYEAQAGGGGADEKVKVSSDDTTADYLINKLTAAGPITLTEVNPAGDEDLRIGYARANVVVVAKTGGDYSTVTAALAAIVDAATDNRYVILVAPDVGGESVTLKSYVDIHGFGTRNTASGVEGLKVAGSPTAVSISNIYLGGTLYDHGPTGAVALTGGTVDFHHCRIYGTYGDAALNTLVNLWGGGTYRFFDCDIYADPTGDDHLYAVVVGNATANFYNCVILNTSDTEPSVGGVFLPDTGTGTCLLQDCDVSSPSLGWGLRCEKGTATVIGGSLNGGSWGVISSAVSTGVINLYGGVRVTGGTNSLYRGAGTINVYAASYDPDSTYGTITGADKDLVVGDLTVIDDLMLNGISHGDAEPFDAHANNPRCRAYHSLDQNVATATWVWLAMNSERWDTDGIHDTVTNNSRFTCQTEGLYRFIGHVSFEAVGTGGRLLGIRLNASTFIALNYIQTQSLTTHGAIPGEWYMVVGDYVELGAYQTSGVTLKVLAGSAYSPEFTMSRAG